MEDKCARYSSLQGLSTYRYGAQRLARSYTLSLVTLMLLPLLYTAVLSMLKALARRRGMLTSAAAPGEAAAAEAKVEVQIQRFARIVFILVAVILLANYWGIDTQAFKTLDELNLYRIRGAGDVVEFVTVTINRLVISIGVAYGSDIEKVSEILVQIAREDPDVMKEPAPSVVFMQHGDSSLDFNLRVFIPKINIIGSRDVETFIKMGASIVAFSTKKFLNI
jgi:small-conductance mechanosensitive channel